MANVRVFSEWETKLGPALAWVPAGRQQRLDPLSHHFVGPVQLANGERLGLSMDPPITQMASNPISKRLVARPRTLLQACCTLDRDCPLDGPTPRPVASAIMAVRSSCQFGFCAHRSLK